MTKPEDMKKREKMKAVADVLVTGTVMYHWDLLFQLCTQCKRNLVCSRFYRDTSMLKILGFLLSQVIAW